MNKSELIEAITADADLSKAAAGRALDAVIGAVTGALKDGESVSLVGFGTFSVKARAARTGRNPQTGAISNHKGALTMRRTINTRTSELTDIKTLAKESGIKRL